MSKQFIVSIACWVLFFFSCGIPENTSNSLDFSGVDQFLEITAALEHDTNPDPADWETLFETPGYSMLTKSEFDN